MLTFDFIVCICFHWMFFVLVFYCIDFQEQSWSVRQCRHRRKSIFAGIYVSIFIKFQLIENLQRQRIDNVLWLSKSISELELFTLHRITFYQIWTFWIFLYFIDIDSLSTYKFKHSPTNRFFQLNSSGKTHKKVFFISGRTT